MSDRTVNMKNKQCLRLVQPSTYCYVIGWMQGKLHMCCCH